MEKKETIVRCGCGCIFICETTEDGKEYFGDKQVVRCPRHEYLLGAIDEGGGSY